MVVFSQQKADRNAASKGRRRETALRGNLRDLGAMRREQEIQLGAVRRSVFKRDDGRSLRDKLDPGYCALEVREEIRIILKGQPASSAHCKCHTQDGCNCGACGTPRHETVTTCLAPIKLEGDAYASIRECYKLLDGLRPFSRPRTRACRRQRIAQTVQVFTDGHGVSIEGVCTCGNANGCPVCARKIYLRRQLEIEYMLERWIGFGPGRMGPNSAQAGMLTLTIRHGAGDKLDKTAHGLNEAFRRLFMGRAGQRLKRDFDVAHFVRAFETTHGQANGWHAHLHALILHRAEPTPEALQAIKERWAECVRESLGEQFVPDITSDVGVNYKRILGSEDGKYLAKMGLEIAGIYIKKAKGGNRTYWQIARDAVEGDLYAQHLWVDAQAALFRTKQLTWSRGTRDFFELPALTDEAIAAEGEALPPEPLQVERYRLEVPSARWDDACRRDRFFVSRLVETALAAERSGNWEGVLSLVSKRSGGRDSWRPVGGMVEAYVSAVSGTSDPPRLNCQSTSPSSVNRNDTTCR